MAAWGFRGKRGSRLAGLRRREDKAACRLLGARWHHFPWHDAVYRRGSSNGFLYGSCRQDSWAAEDGPLLDRLTRVLRGRLRANDLVLAPLGIGRHVDHLMTREAAGRLSHPGMMYYPEIPYAQRFPGEMAAVPAGMPVLHYGVSAPQAAAWVRAVHAYRSQRRMLEEAAGPLEKLILSQVASRKTVLFGAGPGRIPEAAAGDLGIAGLNVVVHDGTGAL